MKLVPQEEAKNVTGRPLVLYHCGHEQCKPSHCFGPAIRPHYLIHFILHGQGRYYVNGVTYYLKGGEGFLIHPGLTTFYSADEQDPWEYCWIGFDGSDVSSILHNCGLSLTNLIFTDSSNGILWKEFMALIKQFTEGRGNEFSYLGRLYQCFSYLYRCSEIPSNHVYETHITKAMSYIQNNYSYDIKISDIAKYLCINRTYLYKLFMAHRKESPQQYLIDYRLKVSQKLLKETDLSVSEIAYSCGFRDTPSYNKHFKKHFQITPLQYRSNALYFLI